MVEGGFAGDEISVESDDEDVPAVARFQRAFFLFQSTSHLGPTDGQNLDVFRIPDSGESASQISEEQRVGREQDAKSDGPRGAKEGARAVGKQAETCCDAGKDREPDGSIQLSFTLWVMPVKKTSGQEEEARK